MIGFHDSEGGQASSTLRCSCHSARRVFKFRGAENDMAVQFFGTGEAGGAAGPALFSGESWRDAGADSSTAAARVAEKPLFEHFSPKSCQKDVSRLPGGADGWSGRGRTQRSGR
jgi:hypothetical protein